MLRVTQSVIIPNNHRSVLPPVCEVPCHGQAPGLRVLEADPEGSFLRGGAHGGPERAGMAPAEPPPRGSPLLHSHAARSGVCSRCQLQEREPLQ